MGKIGLITFYENNYGSILQCYATKYFLENHGYECIVVSCREVQQPNLVNKVGKYFRVAIRSLVFKSYYNDFILMKKAARKGNALSETTKKKMNEFVDRYIKPELFQMKTLKKLAETDEFDKFIVGSDQVWNVSFDLNDFYFLTFSPYNKRIAFSVSVGLSELSDYERYRLKNRIGLFSSISVREKTGQQLLESMGAKDVKKLSDPTVLLNGKEWQKFEDAKKCCQLGQHYILIHFLNTPSDVALQYFNYMQETTNSKLIMIGYNYPDLNKNLRFDFYDADPREYIAWINHADFVLTDSYHTTLFSINLGTSFYAFRRMYNHNSSQESRLIDLLEELNMSDRYISSKNAVACIGEKHEFTCNEIIEENRRQLQQWLLKKVNAKEE